MDDHQFEDLKQLITTSASQTEQFLGEKITRIEEQIQGLRQEMHNGFAGAGDSTTEINDQLSDHEQRIVKLESAT